MARLLGNDNQDIKALLTRWQETLTDRMPTKAPLLAQPLSRFELARSLPILDIRGEAPPAGAFFRLRSDAAFSIKSELDDVGDRRMRLGFDGALEVAGGVGVPPLLVRVGASGDLRLEFLYDFAGHDPIAAQALAAAATHTPNPLDYQQVREALADEHFLGCQVSSMHTVQLGASLRLDRQFVFEGGRDQSGVPLAIETRLGADLGVNWLAKGSFQLSVGEDEKGWIRVELRANRQRQRDLSLRLGSEINLEGVQQVAVPTLRRLLPDETTLREWIEKFPDPAEIVADEIHKLLGDNAGLAQAIENVLSGKVSTAEFSPRIVDLVTSRVTTALRIESRDPQVVKDLLAGAEASLQALANRVIEEVIDNLELPPNVAEQARDLTETLKGELSAVRQRADAKFDEVIESLQGISSTAKTKVAEFLAEADAPIEHLREALDGVSERAETLKRRLQDAVSRYVGLRNQVITAAQDASRYRLGVSVSHVHSRARDSGSLLSISIDPRGPEEEIADLYREMVGGDFARAIRQATDDASPWLVLEDGWFEESLRDSRSFSLSMNIFGIGFEQSTLMTSDVDVRADAQGRIVAATARAGVTRTKRLFREQVRTQVFNLREYAAALEVDADTAPVPFGFGFDYADRDLERGELVGLLNSLIDGQLLESAVLEEIEPVLQSLDDGERSGEVSFNVDLTNEEFSSIVRQPGELVVLTAIRSLLQYGRFHGRADDVVQVLLALQERGHDAALLAREIGRRGSLEPLRQLWDGYPDGSDTRRDLVDAVKRICSKA
ncbi:MAG: hypothetical protein AAFX85_09075, partial [Pseudomonadota bacterium]